MERTVERWDVFEVSFYGPSDGNPFAEQWVKGTFRGEKESVTTYGFYDGDGMYRIRFMPSYEGAYTYTTWGTFPGAETSGSFTVTPAGAENHGPVRVRAQYHFAYEDGTPYYPAGTTCYVWTQQPEAVRRQTLQELDKGCFNKMRFCVMPKHYVHNFHDPETFPFVGTPMDASVLTEQNFGEYTAHPTGNHFDYDRLNPEHFRRIEAGILQLRERGIEADLIVMHPYDRWGFCRMTRTQDDRYWRYVIARFSAYRNLWWSLANEYDILDEKTEEDWEHYADLLCRLDPYGHLRSIHNCLQYYDYTRPWVTHCSMQRIDLYRHVEETQNARERYGKPVVWDEIAYEGDIEHGWGNISGEELTRRFWEACLRGGYGGHGETFLCPEGVLWWSHGGPLRGESPARIRFLSEILAQTPGPGLRHQPGAFDETVAVPDVPGETEYEIRYYGFQRPSYRTFRRPEGERWRVEVIDTWNMTVEDVGVYEGWFRIPLPARPYLALRLRKEME